MNKRRQNISALIALPVGIFVLCAFTAAHTLIKYRTNNNQLRKFTAQMPDYTDSIRNATSVYDVDRFIKLRNQTNQRIKNFQDSINQR